MTAPDGSEPVTPLLATKLHPPRRRRALVDRPRLDDLARRSRHRALTLVSAPAGFGKTTLVAGWLGGEEATAWLSLDADDDDPVRFWRYVVAALEEAVPDLGTEVGRLLEAPVAPLDAVVATLINDLETASHDVVLILDDYHLISSPEVHRSVAFLLEHLPPQIRLVVVTRSDPPFPLSALRADGELLEVRAADLRFTAEEAGDYLADAMDLPLRPEEVEVLESRTEGWIAALQLAALSMQGRSDPSSFVAAFAGDDRFILDYLADEVLAHQEPEVRDFLLATSILPRLTGPLCAAVTDRPDARAVLEQLERANLFLVALDDRRTWYRYHHLFGDVLRARLLDDQPERVAELHARASRWYAESGDLYEAITQALAGGDRDRAADLIERVAPEAQRIRKERQLRTWLESLPAEVLVDRPVLADTLAGARMATGDATGVEGLLDLAEAALADDGRAVVVDDEQLRQLPAMLAIHRAGLALLAGDLEATVRHASRARALADDRDQLQQGAASALLGLARWAGGELAVAQEHYADAVERFEVGGYRSDLMGVSLALADIQLARGRLREAEATLQHALDLAAEHPGLRGAADVHVGLAEVLIERDELHAATVHLEAAAERGEAAGLPQHPYRWRVTTARLRRARGDLEGALTLLDQALPLYATDFSPPVRPVGALRARVQLACGDVDAAAAWVRERGLGVDDPLTYVGELEHLTLARVLLAQAARAGDPALLDRARELLERLRRDADAGGRTGSTIEALVLLGAAHRGAGDGAAAIGAIEEALQRAEPEGHVRVLLHGGPGTAELLRSVADRHGPESYAARVAAAASGVARADGPVRPARTSAVDALSDRELDVLRLLRSDLSGPEIARELHVSLNTLRTHTKHIYTKLGATNRREALTRAAALGL